MLRVVIAPHDHVVCVMNFDFFCRYMEGKCTPGEAEHFQQWSEQHPREVEAWFERLWQEKDTTGNQYTKNKKTIWERLQPLPPLHSYGSPGSTRINMIARWSAAAACIAVLVGAGWWFTRKQAPAPMAWVRLTNKDTLPRKYTLPDSSTVWLNCQATLDYAPDFGRNERNLNLSGEAFFDVAKDAAHPFAVQAGSATIVVLGTSFNVDAYPGEREVHISLVQGSVSVKAAGTADLLLKPGEIAMVTKGAKRITKQPFTVDNVSAWTTGKLVLDQVALEDVMQRLQHRTGIRIRLDQKIRKRELKISGIYDWHAVYDILKSIAFVHRLQVVREAADSYYLKE